MCRKIHLNKDIKLKKKKNSLVNIYLKELRGGGAVCLYLVVTPIARVLVATAVVKEKKRGEKIIKNVINL